jgi:eukaryotic-like serine/threonine-protein kinase
MIDLLLQDGHSWDEAAEQIGCSRASRRTGLGNTAARHTAAGFVAFLTDIAIHQPDGKEIRCDLRREIGICSLPTSCDYTLRMKTPELDPADVRRLFLQVLDLPAPECARFLSGLSSEMRDEIHSLLDSDEGSETMLRGIVDSGRLTTAGVQERFGPFVTTELVGRGGMGAVYKAERADGELSQIVAIKVIERGWLNPRAIERFRRERQILAGLDHPNIARLIDGGTRDDGVPYLVMEFVDGIRIDDFCNRKNLKLADRLALFLPICDAIDAAHQQLIVHRDLKPSNVIVDLTGAPKLLDFGIAKVLGAAPGEMTQTVMLTPDFASPEQARGESVTTATDIYGLGAVLYLLLTGRAPRHIDGHASEIRRQVSETPLAQPSTFNPELAGDIENILLQAMHSEPARRYRTARDMGDDIRRYLAHRPVLATPDRISYRMMRFAQRHRVACAMGALAIAAAGVGAGVSIYEAHRAQQRFAQVRELANHFVFDFESAIRDTPGTLAARRMVASTAREYLAQLSADAGRDPNLKRELAESYGRLARVEMSAGENAAYVEHLQKSIELRKGVKDDCCGSPAAHFQYIAALTDLARTNDDSRSREQAAQQAASAAGNARAWYVHSPGESYAARALMIALSTEGNIRAGAGHNQDARKDLQEATRLGEELVLRRPDDEEIAYDRARAGNWLAGVLNTVGDTPSARVEEEHAIAAMDKLLEHHPGNFRWRNLRVRMESSTAGFLRSLAQSDPSLQPLILPTSRRAYQMALANVHDNPGDRDLLDTAVVMASRLANETAREGHQEAAIPFFNEMKTMIDELLRSDPNDARYVYLLAVNRTAAGRLLMNLNRWPEAVPILLEAEQSIGKVLDRRPQDLSAINVKATIFLNQTIDERHLGHFDLARRRCALAVQTVQELTAKNKEARTPFEDLAELRREAHTLGVPDAAVVPH